MCLELDLLLPVSENEAGAPQGAPRTIERSPRNLIGEARLAFNAGLLISCLTVLVTIPDVCSNLIDSSNKDGQRDWCTRYLGFPSTPVVDGGKTTSPHPISASCETLCSIPDLRSLTAREQNIRRSIRSAYMSSTTTASW